MDDFMDDFLHRYFTFHRFEMFRLFGQSRVREDVANGYRV